MMEWLKAILDKAEITDGVLNVEKLQKDIEAEFPKHAVPKADFNDAKEQLKTANATIETLKKDNKDNEALQEALINGEIQVVATDHCSFTREQKLSSDDCRTIYPGIPGTEELLPLIHTFGLTSGRLSLSQIVNLLSTGPAKLFGLYPEKGSLEVGTDADITLFDPDCSWTISKDTIHSAAGYSAYEGFSVTGKVVMTYLRGRLIMGDDIYLGLNGDGKYLRARR